MAKEDLERDWESTFYPDIPEVLENVSGKPFPEGTYWRTGETYAGGQTGTVEAPIDVIPVFSRNGAKRYCDD